MADLKNPKVIWAKGILFLLVGVLASAMLIAQAASLQVAVLLGISIWAFCRFYYFAFYVIEHYVDAEYKFAGLIAFARYTLQSKRR
ncbi:hypothetical protein Pla52o_20070 [Novipirellula galeiformis]|uniref:Uncharacterized protein n=1 Tax=Novipirellula galeiformis TaxID=2528004 RepID=A0A5C6CKT6_9BACT|nr:hypothetical protein [Novipirellula galeiformis]TWU24084.1 hypothetical protein Pla52o_20070 [Novipirellula galeiformis]